MLKMINNWSVRSVFFKVKVLTAFTKDVFGDARLFMCQYWRRLVERTNDLMINYPDRFLRNVRANRKKERFNDELLR